ncbi:MAG: flagellar export protein FliJ [Methylibium sp.]|uniref:flagellar export protein FliJ n=1 Tax=Methylibium sp. TaxID=2067992 RepID=UPI0017A145B1|nr:flagellar export protein FliJ [Methylibium sp.]MBA3597368.1 flagellar export protein FliJ [Methylibium sp.]
MSDILALQTLLEQAGAARDKALAAHRHALASVQAAQVQAGQLAAYRLEYADRFGKQFQQSGAIELLQCYQGFMSRLDDAVTQQGHVVTQAAARADDAKATLLAAELRAASVQKLIERRTAEVTLRSDRREQKATDEFAARVAWQRLAAGGGPDALGFGAA